MSWDMAVSKHRGLEKAEYTPADIVIAWYFPDNNEKY